MSKKITDQEFLQRFYRNYPDEKIKLLNYTAISNTLTLQCLQCGKKYTKRRAREFLTSFKCCSKSTLNKIDKLKTFYSTNQEFEFIKQTDKDHFIVHHNKCGNDITRVISNSMDNPFACKYCDTSKQANMLSIKEVQNVINTRFDSIQILDYNGQLESNHYKCLKCGLIFTQKQVCLMQSRGCPKCDRFKSMGEKKLRAILEEHNILFKEQVSVKELPLQHFDFAVYDNDNKLQYFIEVQGEQHYEERSIFRDGLKKIQERDNKKREYCKNNNITLYEIKYFKGELLNIDILPF